MAEQRCLGQTDILVSSVALGCWPISGMTSLDVHDAASIATLHACHDAGINFLDTAYCYGAQGESERLIARALGSKRSNFVLATKAGIHWAQDGMRVIDGRPQTLKKQCEESLRRLHTDRVELLYLHAPDPEVPLEDSAAALFELMKEGKTRSVGASNLSRLQLQRFNSVCPLSAYQPPYNLLQRQIEAEILPWCRKNRVSVMVYWPLMKGLLAGRLARDYSFPPEDGRAKYPMFQGEEWQRNVDFVDRLREIATSCGSTVAQLAVAWVLSTPGITSALCGAKRPDQIQETAAAMNLKLDPALLSRIDSALVERGDPRVEPAVPEVT